MLKQVNVVHKVKALRLVRRMRGGSQASLLECDDGHAYVTKLRYNPQGPNILANEWIANAMARSVNLPVPECAMVELDENFIRQNPDLRFKLARASYMPPPGVHFGSRFLKPEGEGSRLLDHLNSSQLSLVEDQQSYRGITLFDLLTESDDRRQAVHIKHENEVMLSTVFIDFGHHFRGPSWTRPHSSSQFFCYSVRTNPKLWANSRLIEYWLSTFRKTLPHSLSHSIAQVPGEWHSGNIHKIEVRYLKRIAVFDSIVHGFTAQSSQPEFDSASLLEREASL